MHNVSKRALALLPSLLLTGSVLAASPSPAAAVEPAVKIIDANLDGGSVSYALAKANDQDAKIMTLQELCRTQLDSLGVNWNKSSYLVTKPGGCDDGSDKGQAIVTRGIAVPSGAATHYYLTNPGDVDGPTGPDLGDTNRSAFALTCFTNVDGLIDPWLTVCTTHLFTNGGGGVGGDVRETQMNEIEAQLLPWAASSRKVIFTGDLNMQPGNASLDQIYNNFTEAAGQRTGAPATTDSSTKLDYVFADSSPALVAKSLNLNDSVYSGHHILKASITFP